MYSEYTGVLESRDICLLDENRMDKNMKREIATGICRAFRFRTG